MGLTIDVGILPFLRDSDEEGYRWKCEEFSKINEMLRTAGLPEYHEPTALQGAQPWSCDMLGYSGLHTLRRIAAHLWAGQGLPRPGDADAGYDPLIERYCSSMGQNSGRFFAQLLRRTPPPGPRFDHLMFHSDTEGYYVPIDFEEVLFAPPKLSIPGGMVGSSIRLLKECKALAEVLEVPLDLEPESAEVSEAVENPGEGETVWKQYSQESYACLVLLRACEASVKLGAAIVFG